MEFPSFFFYIVLPTHMIKPTALLATPKVRGTRRKGLHNESMDTAPQICKYGYYNTQLLENTEWHMFHF